DDDDDEQDEIYTKKLLDILFGTDCNINSKSNIKPNNVSVNNETGLKLEQQDEVTEEADDKEVLEIERDRNLGEKLSSTSHISIDSDSPFYNIRNPLFSSIINKLESQKENNNNLWSLSVAKRRGLFIYWIHKMATK